MVLERKQMIDSKMSQESDQDSLGQDVDIVGHEDV
jgi:hypothetical protein